jgi:hypothetical protein
MWGAITLNRRRNRPEHGDALKGNADGEHPGLDIAFYKTIYRKEG